MTIVQQPIPFSLKIALRYFTYKTIFARYVHDESVIPLFPKLRGKVLELGAGVHDYSKYAVNCKEYIKSDYRPNGKNKCIHIDATSIDFCDDSLDAVVCMSALEHIEDFNKVISEIHRVLRPGGKLLMNTPWFFPFHGAPNDYYRFSASAIQGLLSKNFKFDSFKSVGNFWLSQAMFLQRPKWSRVPVNGPDRWYDNLLKGLGVLFYWVGSKKIKDAVDDNYALLYCALCEKLDVK